MSVGLASAVMIVLAPKLRLVDPELT